MLSCSLGGLQLWRVVLFILGLLGLMCVCVKSLDELISPAGIGEISLSLSANTSAARPLSEIILRSDQHTHQ